MKKYSITFVTGFLSAVLILLVIQNFLSTNQVIKIGSNQDNGCFGWQRDGLMSEDENAAFSDLRTACIDNDLPSINKYLSLSEGAIEVSCLVDTEIKEPAIPSLNLQVKNISSEEIYLIEQSSYIDAETIYFSPSSRANSIKIVEPNEVIDYEVIPELEGYGIYTFDVGIGGYRMTSKSDSSSVMTRDWLKTDFCSFDWVR